MLLQTEVSAHSRHHSNAVSAEEQVPEPKLPAGGLNLKQHVEQIELSLIRQALEQSKGVVARAARLLRLRRTTLVEKMRKYRNGQHRFDYRGLTA